MPRVEARQKRQDRGPNIETEAMHQNGEAEAALLLPRDETSVSRHISLVGTQ